ncbi:hypothetical protein HY772_00510 [Candidatus Woesearchaeota archaeon]|nr:hypothetical protein [Candidatus Woesearchaeota archaeon]
MKKVEMGSGQGIRGRWPGMRFEKNSQWIMCFLADGLRKTQTREPQLFESKAGASDFAN